MEEEVELSPRWRIRYEDLTFDFSKPLGRGTFGTVWKGEYIGSPVAIKQLALGGYVGENDFVKYLKREVKNLASVRHPNIVQFLGIATKTKAGGPGPQPWASLVPEDVFLVTEFLEGGDLSRLKDPSYSSNWKLRVTILRDIARAMRHIHTLGKQLFSFQIITLMCFLLHTKIRYDASRLEVWEFIAIRRLDYDKGLRSWPCTPSRERSRRFYDLLW